MLERIKANPIRRNQVSGYIYPLQNENLPGCAVQVGSVAGIMECKYKIDFSDYHKHISIFYENHHSSENVN